MAAGDAQPWPIKSHALRLTFPMFTSAGALVTTGTMAVTISKDGGTFGNPNAGATNATQIATTSGVWYVDLNTTDTACDTLAVKISDGTNPPTILVVYPFSLAELSAPPGYADGATGLEEVLSWLVAVSRNKITQTATTTLVKKDDTTTTLGTSTVSDDGTTFTRGEFA